MKSFVTTGTVLAVSLCIAVSSWDVSAFTVNGNIGARAIRSGSSSPSRHIQRYQQSILFAADDSNSNTDGKDSDMPTIPPTGIVAEPIKSVLAPVVEEETAAYPIDLPSPILLSASMVLAIIGTGSAFDLAGGSQQFGFATSAAVAVISIPTCLFLFYASILKATAETEADDEEYLKGN